MGELVSADGTRVQRGRVKRLLVLKPVAADVPSTIKGCEFGERRSPERVLLLGSITTPTSSSAASEYTFEVCFWPF
ncbi:protein of unknown function [Hyphomicrobium sp. MC1]|nr:protein of unknown function [Hyphomicrobium sp. MC1]